MTITDLKPSRVWQIFHEITQVPRPSGNLDKIRNWLVSFAQKHGLEYKIDQVGNVAIFRPAAPGFENAKKVVLQGHMDMVAEKASNSNHDFNNDPIQTIIDGEWVRANNTTLGADDGLGLAIALAAITDPDIKCGALEALATVDEETGLTGASNIKPDMLQGDYLLNLDSEDDGVITIGCAGGLVSIATFDYKPTPAQAGLIFFELSLLSLHGGHSGTDINCGYASATKLIARLLWTIKQDIPFQLACIDSGNLHNAISRDAKAVIGINPADKEKLAVIFNRFVAEIQNEYRHTEKNMDCRCVSVDAPETVIDCDTASRLIDAVFVAPHGVYSMSLEMEGLVETSTNLASVKMRPGNKLVIEGFQMDQRRFPEDDIARSRKADQFTAPSGMQRLDRLVDFILRNIEHDGIFIGDAQLFPDAGIGLGQHFSQRSPDLTFIGIGIDDFAGQDFTDAEQYLPFPYIGHFIVQ